MLLIRLLLSGLLVASGLILGAFTLHGYLDPQWAQRQMQAAGAAAHAEEAKAAGVFQSRSRFVESQTQRSNAPPKAKPVPAVVHQPKAPQSAVVKAADAKAAARQARKNRQAERARKTPPPPPQQQASFVWPWNLFKN